MRVFLTGATGFIGTAVIAELTKAGHKVLGLARTDEGAKAISSAGVEVLRGSIQDLDALKKGVKECDGAIHAAFNHDFSKFAQNCADDKLAIETMGAALVGTEKPLIVSAGVGFTPGRTRTEEDAPNPSSAMMPRESEQAAEALAAKGVNASTMRLPQVHDPFKQGLITYMISLAREKGEVAYVGDGTARFPSVHLVDCARLYRLALEKGSKGSVYNAVAEEGVTHREIVESLGRGLKMPVVAKTPEEAAAYFGWLSVFMSLDMVVSSAITQKRFGWHPTECGLIEDLDKAKF